MWKFQEFFWGFFSRTHAFIFTYGFFKKFSRTHFCFHGQLLRKFHGRKNFFTDGNPKNLENFHGRDFDFHAGKKNAGKYKASFNRNNKISFFYHVVVLSLKGDLLRIDTSESKWLSGSLCIVFLELNFLTHRAHSKTTREAKFQLKFWLKFQLKFCEI